MMRLSRIMTRDGDLPMSKVEVHLKKPAQKPMQMMIPAARNPLGNHPATYLATQAQSAPAESIQASLPRGALQTSLCSQSAAPTSLEGMDPQRGVSSSSGSEISSSALTRLNLNRWQCLAKLCGQLTQPITKTRKDHCLILCPVVSQINNALVNLLQSGVQTELALTKRKSF